MTMKRFEIGIGEFEEENIVDNQNKMTICKISDICKKMNDLHEENKELKEVIEEVFEMVTNLDYVRKQYLNGLLNVLGEENDVDKTKKRIKEFLE